MTTPSETVQAAQRLLADRESVGLAKYGTTVDRTDLSPEQWLSHMRDELSDGLLYAMRALQTLRDRSTGPAPEFIVSPIVCPDTPDAHTLTLKIGVQSFRIGGGLDYDTREEAEWTAKQLLRALANMQQPSLCECRDRLAESCPGTWEPGCDMGANEAHAVPAGEDAEAALKKAKRAAAHDLFAQFAKSDVQPVESGPMPEHPLPDPVAEGFRRKAERASRLARWANAPDEATHLAQDTGGSCNWFEREPVCDYDGQLERWSEGGRSWGAPTNSLGRVACEPRPTPEGGQEGQS